MRVEVAKAKVDFEIEKVKKDDAIDEKNHLNKVVDDFRSLKDECFSLAAKCSEELESTFSAVGERSQKRNFVDGDIFGEMKWIDGQVGASTLLGVCCDHVKACLDPNFMVPLENIRMSSIEASNRGKKFLLDIWNAGGKAISLEESKKNKKKVFIR